MTPSEYHKEKQALLALAREQQKVLRRYIESLITVYGHAWCMDVKSERKKIAKLIAENLFIPTSTPFPKLPHLATSPQTTPSNPKNP